MVAFIYNEIPDAQKDNIEVVFVTSENLSQVQRVFPMLDGTPMLIDRQTGVSVKSGDATVYAMLNLAYMWGVRVRLSALSPACEPYDRQFQAMVQQASQARPAEPQRPATAEDWVAHILSQPAPARQEERLEIMNRVKQALGYVPVELMAKYSQVQKDGKIVSGSFVSPHLEKM